MAVSITSRPADIFPSNRFVPVKIPAVYKFTTTGGPFVNYRIEVEVFRASDNTSLTGGVKFSFSPNINNITFADISSIVKAFLKADWIKPTTLNEKDTDTEIKIYIKYQELYDGSATAIVSDVATPIHCVFGAFQIPSVNVEYSSWIPADGNRRLSLMIFDRPKLWRDYLATLSFIYPDALGELYVYSAQHNVAGTIIGNIGYNLLTSINDDSVNRLDIINVILDVSAKTFKKKLALYGVGAELLANPSFVATLDPWFSEAGPSSAWTWNVGEYAETNIGQDPELKTSNNLVQTFASKAADWYVIEYTVEPNDTNFTIFIEAYFGVSFIAELDQRILTSAVVQTHRKLVLINGTFERIKIRVKNEVFDPPIFELHDFSLKPFTPSDYTKELTFDVEDACSNPVMLVWKNSLGGDAFWLFEHGQEAGYNYSGSKKANRMTLFAEHLTLNQWEALNELNTLGEVYSQNIQEFTTAINKTSIRDGSQVYIIDTSGNRTGVIVIPTNSVINTKDEVHSIEIEIELPERL